MGSLPIATGNGVKSVGTLFRDDGIGPQSMILPEPVHYHTDEFRSGLDWHGERGQANLDYYYSRFTNDDAGELPQLGGGQLPLQQLDGLFQHFLVGLPITPGFRDDLAGLNPFVQA